MKKIPHQLHTEFLALSIEHPYERLVLRYLLAIFCACLCGYLYFVSSSVLNVIAQREADQYAQKLEGRIGTLEQRYFALSHEVTPQNAALLGLVPIQKTAYVYRPGSVGIAPVSRNAL